jgi:hypothetical protein
MKLLMVAGVFWWVVIAVWVVRLFMGLDHLSKDQIPAAIVGGVCGGLGAWYYVPRHAKKLAAERKGN